MSTSPSDLQPVAADYFDGQTTRAHKVTLTLSGDALLVQGDAANRREPLSTLRVSEPMGAAPRLISFNDGAHCEVRDHARFSTLLARSGHADSVIVRLQQYWRAAVASVALTIAALVAGYVWGLPALSEWIAFRVPEPMLAQLGGGTLQFLDRVVLKPSELPMARQQSLRTQFARLVFPDGVKVRHQIQFRKGQGMGANALAIPDGTIVMTDELVKLATTDEEVIAVLTHELGHLHRRHSVRMLIQSSIIGFIVAWYVGDVSTVAAGLPAMMLQARYSRDHEREADDFGATMLRANGISPRRLGEMLLKLSAAHRRGDAQPTPRSPVNDYYASHPATEERIKALE